MRYVALAAGFDGTLAHEGRCDERCIDVLREISATGRKLILVTGRELRDLLEIFPEARIFDYIVAENGAVMHRTGTRHSEILAQAPPEILLQELRRRRITPLSVGSSIISTARANHDQVSDALRKLDLDFDLVPNEDTLLILPPGINKGYGVKEALKELGVSRHNLVAIGDGANDLPLLATAEHAVAVKNADLAVQRAADRITHGEYCDGFLEVAYELMSSDLAMAVPRCRIMLGRRQDQEDFSLTPCRDSVLVSGRDDAARAMVCGRLLEQLLEQEYQCCVLVVDAGGGASALTPGVGAMSGRTMTGMRIWGDAHDVPRLTDVLGALEHPVRSVEVNLAALPPETRSVFADALLLQLQALHDRTGRPHCILIDQAHRLLAGGQAATATTRLVEVTMIYSSAEAEQLPPQVLDSVEFIVVAGTDRHLSDIDDADVRELREALGKISGRDYQAIAAGGDGCNISLLLPASSGSRSPSAEDVTASEY